MQQLATNLMLQTANLAPFVVSAVMVAASTVSARIMRVAR